MIEAGVMFTECPGCGLPIYVQIVASALSGAVIELHPGEMQFLCECDGSPILPITGES